MSYLLQIPFNFVDSVVDLFFKKVLLIEEIQVLRRYDEEYFRSNTEDSENKIDDRRNLESQGLISVNSIKDPNFTKAEIFLNDQKNNEEYNFQFSSNENKNNIEPNVFLKLSNGKNNLKKAIKPDNKYNNVLSSDFDIDNITNLKDSNKNIDKVIIEINSKGDIFETKGNKIFKDINNNFDEVDDINSFNQNKIYKKINNNFQSENDVFCNNMGVNIQDSIVSDDINSLRNVIKNENIIKRNSYSNKFNQRNSFVSHNSKRNSLRGLINKKDLHEYDSHSLNDDEIFEIKIENHEKCRELDSNKEIGDNLNRKKKSSNFKKIAKTLK